MKLWKKAGATSEIWQIFIADSSSTTGAGLTGLLFNTASLTAYYHRDTNTTATAIALVTMTVGTFTSSGFKEIDATNMPGWYQFCPPDAANAASAKSCAFLLKGATNMVPCPIEVQLTAVDPDDAVAFGLSRLDAAITSRMATYTQPTGFLAATFPSGTVANTTNITAGTITTVTTVTNQLTAAQIATGVWQDATAGDFTTASSIGKSLYTSGNAPGAASGLSLVGSNMGTVSSVTGAVGSVTAAVLISAGTGAGQLDFTSGVVKSNLSQILGTALTETAGQIAAAFKKFFNIATPASTMDHLTLIDTVTTATTATNLTNAPTAGDFTAAMKTSLNAATPASVTGAVGSVTGAVGSVTAGVTLAAAAVDNVALATSGINAIWAAASRTLTGNQGIKKNTALAAFPFLMTDSTTHAPKTGLTVTATRSLDGAAFGACTNSAVEVGSGWYKIDLSAGDTNGNTVALRFTATNADDRNLSFATSS